MLVAAVAPVVSVPVKSIAAISWRCG